MEGHGGEEFVTGGQSAADHVEAILQLRGQGGKGAARVPFVQGKRIGRQIPLLLIGCGPPVRVASCSVSGIPPRNAVRPVPPPKTYRCEWAQLSTGQRKLYQNLVFNGRGRQSVAIVHHRMPQDGQPIDTVHDVLGFQVAYYEEGRLMISDWEDGQHWVE